ncbi:CPCC family cysteine-rich protein [uncultured Clostridium sp.]|uniref:CPCC family cysteine-rich protein n=1 Tax=uncultured Clostridium sp. TaxID=59620 RepID=UPI0028E92663|nr:CPCC family cysteine-rich protein [uncultured Clostridium sp.]
MNSKQYKYLPVATYGEEANNRTDIEVDIIGNSPCPCCRFITIPNNGDALAYICPICFWEIDLFIKSDDETSDQNHGLTLIKARKNYQQFGAVLPNLKKYCRQPKEHEYPTK